MGDTPEIICDIVILSFAKDESFNKMTQKAIDTCVESFVEHGGKITVIEQNKDVIYADCKTLHLFSIFNYNKFANIGASKGNSKYICIANNDLIFHKGWLDEIIKANHPVCSPKCPNDSRQTSVIENELGYQVGRHFSGWCFVIERKIWEQIGGFDEDFGFWFADNSVVEQVKAFGITPMIVASSLVTHLYSTTLSTLDKEKKDEITIGQIGKFNKKYNQNHFR